VAFGIRVREQRKRLGWSQMDMAERVGLHFTYLSQIERGERNPSLVNILRLAKSLNINPAALVSGIEPPPDVVIQSE